MAALSSSYMDVVLRAARILGGVPALSDRIGIAKADITRWMNGESEPTTEEFLRVVDVLLEADQPIRGI
jgi:hypothetical protein